MILLKDEVRGRSKVATKTISKDDPIHNAPNQNALRNAIFKEINNSHLVVDLPR